MNRRRFWESIEMYLTGEDIARPASETSALGAPEALTRLDEHHAFGPKAELIVDRSATSPVADSRLVHYDPLTESYVIFTGERIRFNTLDGVTVFQETSPWDTQNRQDPPVNFHIVVEPVGRSGIRHFAGREEGNALRGPILYPRTETMDAALVRNLTVFSPAGIAFHAKELRVFPKTSGPDVRVGMRFGLHGDELLVSVGAKNISARHLKVSLIGFFMPLLTRQFAFNAESPWLHEGRVSVSDAPSADVPDIGRVGGGGFLLRSGEEGIACGIRYHRPARTAHWNNTSSLKYYGGMDRNAAFPAGVRDSGTWGRGAADPAGVCLGKNPGRESQSGFVAPACAHTRDEKILRPGDTLDVHFSVRAFKTSGAAADFLKRHLTPGEVERKIALSVRNAGKLYDRTRLETPSCAFSRSHEWLKQQVSGCARIKTRFRLFWNYLLGVRDKAQAAAAAVDFDPRIGRGMILELSGQQFEDGRFPRQYSFENAYDLRYFMDSGLWMPTMLVPHYLKCTGDFGVLEEPAGYKILRNWDPVKRTGQVGDSRKRGTVLDHLIENVDHVVSNRDPRTGLVNIRDGDWNDAIGLIQNSTMVLEQLYMALARMVELEANLPGNISRTRHGKRLSRKIPQYLRLMDELHRSFWRYCVQKSPDGRIRVIHGYTREGRTVGGFWDSDGVVTEADIKSAIGKFAARFRDSDGQTLYKLHRRWTDMSCKKIQRLPEAIKNLFLVDRISSTPMSFALLSGILRHRSGSSAERRAPGADPAGAMEDAISRDAQALDSRYGFKTFSLPFNKHSRELLIGRIGNLDGAENASPYVHAGAFLCQGLYRIGREDMANGFIDKTLPINRTLHAGQNRGINYIPNSWGIGPNNDGTCMNDFHTNAASILSRILVEEVIGLKPTYPGIEIQPVRRLPRTIDPAGIGPITYSTELRGRPITIVHRWTDHTSALGAPGALTRPMSETSAPGASETLIRQVMLGRRRLDVDARAPRGIPQSFVPWAALRTSPANVITIVDPSSPLRASEVEPPSFGNHRFSCRSARPVVGSVP